MGKSQGLSSGNSLSNRVSRNICDQVRERKLNVCRHSPVYRKGQWLVLTGDGGTGTVSQGDGAQADAAGQIGVHKAGETGSAFQGKG